MAHLLTSEAHDFLFLSSFFRLLLVITDSGKCHSIICLTSDRSSSIIVTPYDQVSACLTYGFGKGLHLLSILFSMSSIALPYLCWSVKNRKSIAWYSLAARICTSSNCSLVGFVTPFFFSIAHAPCSYCPICSPS